MVQESVPQNQTQGPGIAAEVVAAYQQHGAGLLRYGTAMTGNPDEARDAVQEVFLRYFQERNCGRCIEHPQAWLYRVLRNYLLDHFRSAALQPPATALNLESVPDRQSSPETLMAHTELVHEIASALSDRELDCLRLRSEGMSYADIAQTMGVQSGTVGAFLSRVQKKLRPVARNFATIELFEAARFLFAEVHDVSR